MEGNVRDTLVYAALVYATREPPKIELFDWFSISGY